MKGVVLTEDGAAEQQPIRGLGLGVIALYGVHNGSGDLRRRDIGCIFARILVSNTLVWDGEAVVWFLDG